MIKQLWNRITLRDIDPLLKCEFLKELGYINHKRLIIAAIPIIIISLIYVIVDIVHIVNRASNTYYIYVHLPLLSFSLIACFFSFWKKARSASEIGTYRKIINTIIINLLMVLVTIITGMDQIEGGDISAYLFVMFAVTSFYLFTIFSGLLFFSSASILFFISVTMMQHNPAVLTGFYLNGFCFTVIAFLFSRFLFQYQLRDFLNKKTIEGHVNKLERISGELASANMLMKKELIMARQIQSAIMPGDFPDNNVINISVAYLPMEETGGDFYDMFMINETKLGIIVADVSGHGVSSALITMMAKMCFNNHSKKYISTSKIMHMVNEELCGVLTDIDNYITVFYGIIDFENNEMEYINAGHNDILIVRKNANIEHLTSQTSFLGKFSGILFQESTVRIEKGDRIVLYTDGIIECRNNQKEFLGLDSFKNMLLEYRCSNAKEMVRQVVDRINKYTDNRKKDDDMTILVADILSDEREKKPDCNDKDNIVDFIDNTQKFIELDKKYGLVIDAYKNGNYKQAIRICENDLYGHYNRKSDIFKLLHLMGYIYYKMDLYQKTLSIWNEAQIIYPANQVLVNNIEVVKNKIYKMKDILR